MSDEIIRKVSIAAFFSVEPGDTYQGMQVMELLNAVIQEDDGTQASGFFLRLAPISRDPAA